MKPTFPTPQDIGALIRAARKSQSLRQDELAGAAGVGVRFIVDLEAGKVTAQLGKTLRVLATLGCTVEIGPPGRSRSLSGRNGRSRSLSGGGRR